MMLFKLFSSVSGKASAMATSFTLALVLIALTTAPLPRAPQPTSAIFIVSLPAAWALRARLSPPAKTAPVTSDVEVFRKSRREVIERELLILMDLWSM
jgi:hypothetical protein